MGSEKIRRLPVVANGGLLGMLSINDLIAVAKPGASKEPNDIAADDVLQALRAIGDHARGPRAQVPQQPREQRVAAGTAAKGMR